MGGDRRRWSGYGDTVREPGVGPRERPISDKNGEPEPASQKVGNIVPGNKPCGRGDPDSSEQEGPCMPLAVRDHRSALAPSAYCEGGE
jgi:hypothetical protein